MSVFWKRNPTKRFIVVMVFVVMCSCFLTRGAYSENAGSDNKKTVALDPGHGGHDKGAKGPNGALEKSVTLKLAEVVATELKSAYNVILTRTDDYWLDSHARTAIANHLKADLFISLHTGGSFLHQASKTYLYYYKKHAYQNLELGNDPSTLSSDRSLKTDWTSVHKRHQATSRLLAKLILNGLNTYTTFEKSEIKGVPLMVFEGADMPAILMEIGYITNPTVEKSLSDIRVLLNIAKGIRKGVDDFFEPARHSSISE